MRFPIAATLACLVLAPPIALLVVILAPTYSSWPLTAALAAAAVCGALGVRREGHPANELRAGAVRGLLVVGGGLLLTALPFGTLGVFVVTWWWLPLVALAGLLAARLALARRPLRSVLAGLGVAFLIFSGGWALAFARAPAAVAEDPCGPGDSADCQLYRLCSMSAERRRLGAIERITEFDRAGGRIRCEYFTWAGIKIGEARGGAGMGSGWHDGP